MTIGEIKKALTKMMRGGDCFVCLEREKSGVLVFDKFSYIY